MITKIVSDITLNDDFLQIQLIFGKTLRYSISDLDKMYIRSIKSPVYKFTFNFAIIAIINLLCYFFLVLNVAYGILVLSIFMVMFQIKYMKTYELCLELNNKKTNKVAIPYYLKNETIDKVRTVRMKINTKSSS
jgi:hypothetical protein